MPEALPLLYSGSVKEVRGREGRDPYVFEFSNRYSIFDWGEMPDSLAGKGEALAVMGDLFFRELGKPWAGWQVPAAYPENWSRSLTASPVLGALRKNGLRHHSLGLIDESLASLPAGAHSRFLAVKALQRPAAVSSFKGGKVEWDYSAYKSRPGSALVPLEVVFRFGAPESSSFLERVERDPAYSRSFGFLEKPKAGEWFPFPIVEFFTKLEPTDRFLSREEAMEVAALTQDEIDELTALTLLLALRLKDFFSPLSLALWDGKFEFSFLPGESGKRGFQLVDSIGPDELRLLGPGGIHFSKEFLRRVYRGTPWYESVGKAKSLAKERGETDWKSICRFELKQEPAPLPPAALEAARSLYPVLAEALAQDFLGKSIYPGLPSISELCRRMKEAK
jgi:phosphoribosylaminoimidazole-succinocarboxamide synthase